MIRAYSIGIQQGIPSLGIPDLELFNLVDELPGHPVDSTVSLATIQKHGVLVKVEKN